MNNCTISKIFYRDTLMNDSDLLFYKDLRNVQEKNVLYLKFIKVFTGI